MAPGKGRPLRVVGYVRETIGPDEGEPAFAQAERVRAWVRRTGAHLVAVCQDVRHPGHPLDREGYRAMLGIIAGGRVDAVVVATLDALSPDKLVQETMMWDLQRRGTSLLPADEGAVAELADPGPDRVLMRDLLSRVGDYLAMTTDVEPVTTDQPVTPEEAEEGDVIVQLIPATRPRASKG